MEITANIFAKMSEYGELRRPIFIFQYTEYKKFSVPLFFRRHHAEIQYKMRCMCTGIYILLIYRIIYSTFSESRSTCIPAAVFIYFIETNNLFNSRAVTRWNPFSPTRLYYTISWAKAIVCVHIIILYIVRAVITR